MNSKDILHCRIGSVNDLFGNAFGDTFKAISVRNPILEKMEWRLFGCKRLYLSKGGRLTLLKSTLSSLPTYYLSLLTVPKSVTYRLEKIQRNFLWGTLEEFKYSLVAWTRCALLLR